MKKTTGRGEVRAASAIFAALLLALCVQTPAQARGPYGSVATAGWSGGAYTDDKSGEFTDCIASASYQSGINFAVIVDKRYDWALAFTHQSWALTQGSKLPIVVSFDNKNTFNVTGVALSTNMVVVPMPTESGLVKSFRAARTMSAFAQGTLFQFKLDGTAVLLPALVNCVKTINTGGLAAATNFVAPVTAAMAANKEAANSKAANIAASRQPSSPTTASSLQPERPQDGPAELQLEAMQIASNFILKAALSHPSLVSRAETPQTVAMSGAAWKADNATGFVRIVPPRPNLTGVDVAAAIVGNDARDCKGKFLSARASELVDSDVVFRGMSACEDSERSDIAEYFIFPRKAGGFVMFSVTTPTKIGGPAPQSPQRDEMNAGFRKAAYTSIGP